MTANEHFFQRRQPAAVLKHGVLKRYPTVFAAKTGLSSGGKVVYLDGFAGPGRYEPREGQTEGDKGSPLLAVQTAGALTNINRDLNCVFVERNRSYAKDLRATLEKEAPASLQYRVREGDVIDHLDEVLELAADRPLLAFLDPFGTGLPYEDMTQRLLARPQRWATEVLFNFNLNSVTRTGGLLNNTGPDRNGRDATLARIDAFLGGDWWREEFRAFRQEAESEGQRRAAAEAAVKVVGRYCEHVYEDTGFHSFPVPIRPKLDAPPLFILILFYRHPDAPYEFNGAVSMANEEWRAHVHAEEILKYEAKSGGQEDLFGGVLTRTYLEEYNAESASKLAEEWVDTIASNIEELVTQSPSVSVRDRTTDLFGTTLGLAREKHLRKAWKSLAQQGVVKPIGKGKLIRQNIYRAE